MTELAVPNDSAASSLRPRPQVELGRRAEVRVEKFLDAATEVFAENGYRHAKLNDIVARAGGSLATLYRVFGDKEGLVHAIIARRLDNMMLRMQALELSGQSPEEALRLTAERIVESMATHDSRVLLRIVIGDGQSFPALRDWYFNNAVAAVRERLASCFEQEIAGGRLRLRNAETAATQFFMMLFGDWMMRIACGYQHEIGAEDLREYAREAVETFLHGALPR